MSDGMIYVLMQTTSRAMCKVGITTRDVGERIKELNAGTGTLPWVLFGLVKCTKVDRVERVVFKALANYRLTAKREIFLVDPPVAMSVISHLLCLRWSGRSDDELATLCEPIEVVNTP